MTAPSWRSQLTIAAVAAAIGTVLVMSSVTDFVPDALEVPVLLALVAIVVVVIAARMWTRR